MDLCAQVYCAVVMGREGVMLFLMLCLLWVGPAAAQQPGAQAVRVSGDVLAVAIPASAFVATLIKKDYAGTKQLLWSGLSTAGATYILKYAVQKERPDHSNQLSFPSLHTGASFAGATFLQRRYGWKVGVPAYVLSTYVGWSRVYGRKHDIWDVAAGAALGTACSFIFTRPFARRHNLSVVPTVIAGQAGIYASFDF